jgi:cobalamin biosynthesis protein CobD/CbiB
MSSADPKAVFESKKRYLGIKEWDYQAFLEGGKDSLLRSTMISGVLLFLLLAFVGWVVETASVAFFLGFVAGALLFAALMSFISNATSYYAFSAELGEEELRRARASGVSKRR